MVVYGLFNELVKPHVHLDLIYVRKYPLEQFDLGLGKLLVYMYLQLSEGVSQRFHARLQLHEQYLMLFFQLLQLVLKALGRFQGLLRVPLECGEQELEGDNRMAGMFHFAH